jgi:hypothetical protein
MTGESLKPKMRPSVTAFAIISNLYMPIIELYELDILRFGAILG